MIKRCFIPMLSLAFLLTGIENAKAESTSVFDDSASFTVAKAVSLGRATSLSNKAGGAELGTSHSGNSVAAVKECDANCQSCNKATGKCKICKAGYQLKSDGTCQEIPVDERNTQCVNLCGEGFFYDRPGAKNNGQELVCTRYKYPCGYSCTTGWDFRYLVNGTNYTCQDARQTENKNSLCRQICDFVDPGHGTEYFYDRPGAKSNAMGQERVCTRYPLDCGYNCTTGWDFFYMVENQKNGLATNYTCQRAQQSSDEVECNRLCGTGYHYDRPGAKNNGQEKVCTKYTLSCGYSCTTGWDIRYLVPDPNTGSATNFTCQSAIQSSDESECKRLCGNDFHYDRPGAKNNGQEKVCTRYPMDCGYACTTGWNIDYLVTDPQTHQATNYTCQTAIQHNDQTQCHNICGPDFNYDRPGALRNGEERVCTRYPLDCGYACTTGWNIVQLKDGSNYTCQTAIQNNDQSECRRLCGSDFYYDRPGDLNGGAEKVCTKYPMACGYACTTGWDIRTLVTDPQTNQATNFTCQTARQDPNRITCNNRYYINQDGDISVPSGHDCVDTYGHYATITMPSGNPVYGEVNIRMWGTATVNGSFKTTRLQSLYNTYSEGNTITFNNQVQASEVILDESTVSGDQPGTKMIFNGGLVGNPTCRVRKGCSNGGCGGEVTTSSTCTCTSSVCQINTQAQAQCPANCSTCDANGTCTVCANGYTLNNGQCQVSCGAGYYSDNNQCKTCPEGCATCTKTNGGLVKCLTCSAGYSKEGISCLADCDGTSVVPRVCTGNLIRVEGRGCCPNNNSPSNQCFQCAVR